MTVRVTVVIPVYNAGPYIERCVASLLAQTLRPGELEVLFIDDGSDDGTQTRLDELAAEHSYIHVEHYPNSGWPGKPRNTGIDHASGNYIMFLDADDTLEPEAMERMHALGARNGSDIVFGKVISDFRNVPHQVFRRTVQRGDVTTIPMFDSLTPHKMFRRAFLLEEDIRFPEGRRRLEDQQMLAHAYLAAKVVSVVGDYVCYHYRKRDDRGNISSKRIVPELYFGNVRDVLDVVLAHSEPGDLQDRTLRRFYRNEMLRRLGGNPIIRQDPEYRERLVREIQLLALDPRFGPGVHAGLPAALRVRSHQLRQGSIGGLVALAERYNRLRATVRLEGQRWEQDVLVIDLRAGLSHDGDLLDLLPRDGRLYLAPGFTGQVPAAERECTDDVAQALAVVVVTERGSSVEWFVPTSLTLRQVPLYPHRGSGPVGLEWVGEARLDPRSAAGGRPLGCGTWDVSVRISAFGLTREARLGSDRAAAATRSPPSVALTELSQLAKPYATRGAGSLSLHIETLGIESLGIEHDVKSSSPAPNRRRGRSAVLGLSRLRRRRRSGRP